MNVTLLTFSQTGNTHKVAEAIAEVFHEGGHITRIVSLKKATPSDATTCDLLGVGTPCFSSQAPTPVKEFLRSLPRLEKKRTFVFATCGGAPGRVLYDLTRLLQSKGAEVIGGYLARGEVHHPAPCLIGRFPKRPNELDLSSARRFTADIIQHAVEGYPGQVEERQFVITRPQGSFYNAVALVSTDSFKRRVLPEPKLDPSRCDSCQWCVYECPMNNINLRPTPILGKNCIRCYRCLTGCPQKAFHVKWRYHNLLVWMFYNNTFQRWFGNVKTGEIVYAED